MVLVFCFGCYVEFFSNIVLWCDFAMTSLRNFSFNNCTFAILTPSKKVSDKHSILYFCWIDFIRFQGDCPRSTERYGFHIRESKLFRSREVNNWKSHESLAYRITKRFNTRGSINMFARLTIRSQRRQTTAYLGFGLKQWCKNKLSPQTLFIGVLVQFY